MKSRGEFVRHAHENEDELFLVVAGRFPLEFRDRRADLHAGEVLAAPRGVEHRPVADEEVQVLLFEPASTVNTADAGGEGTVEQLECLQATYWRRPQSSVLSHQQRPSTAA